LATFRFFIPPLQDKITQKRNFSLKKKNQSSETSSNSRLPKSPKPNSLTDSEALSLLVVIIAFKHGSIEVVAVEQALTIIVPERSLSIQSINRSNYFMSVSIHFAMELARALIEGN
jgi:hypothetical protein